MEAIKTVQMPINRLSYSALTQLLRNPLIFKLKIILGVYDSNRGVSAMVGMAGHEALKFYYAGNPDYPAPVPGAEGQAEAIDFGMQFLDDYSDAYIRYGKTGSREKMLQQYTKAMQFYFNEEPEYHNILICEQKLEAEIKTYDGQQLPLPAVAIPDLVVENKGGDVDIIDFKFVKSHTKYENEDGDPHEDYIKIIQAQFLDHCLIGAKNIHAKRVIFREIKTSANNVCDEWKKKIECDILHNDEGKHPQVRDYVIPLDHEPYRIIFYNLYRDAVKMIMNPETVYLPNLSDTMDGEQAGLLYSQGLISADMSDVEVMHKVKDVALVSKKFVGSRLDRVENKFLLPEERIKVRLAEFGIPVECEPTQIGASVIQYRFKVSRGIRMSSIEKHKADIARALEAKGEIKILAPIPGTALVGIEIAREDRVVTKLEKEHLTPGTMVIPVGVNMQGEVVKVALGQMPHLLIAGATGSGKSVMLHSILHALTKQMSPDEMHLILVDPKRVELVAFSKVKHLRGAKIAYEYEHAVLLLGALIDEMEERYKQLEKAGKRDITEYNAAQKKKALDKRTELAHVVVVIDEFADLMLQGKAAERKKKSKQALDNIVNRVAVEQHARAMVKQGIRYVPKVDEQEMRTVEEMIVRLAAMGRAAGIHMIITTQRPSVDVITGLIKANFPSRIALATASAVDSKVILGEEGAEKLSGKGDMLFMTHGGKVRLQGFLSE